MATMDVYGTWVAHIVTALVLWHIVALFGSHGSASLVRRTQGGAGLGTPLAGETCESTISWAPGDAWSGPMWKLIASRASSRAKAVKISPIAI